MNQRTEIADKAQSPDQLAQHNDAQNLEDRVNAASCVAKVHLLS